MKQLQPLSCKCGKTIGMLYLDKGKVYCLVNDVLARVLIHNCPVCQYSYHWHADEVNGKRQKKPLPIGKGFSREESFGESITSFYYSSLNSLVAMKFCNIR
ncbi:MAG: hypothetical protein H6961_10085 [Chromatiaceae bacterium]|nr:hypothetical protein [Chromatiaceae bacterium]